MPGGPPHWVRQWGLVVALGVIALLASAKIGEDVFEHETNGFDAAVRTWALAHQSPALATLFRWVSVVGSVNPMICVAIAAALLFWQRGRTLVGATVLVAPAAAVATYLGLKDVYARSRPSELANVFEGTYSFPSAHSTASAAICCTLGWVFWREGMVSGRVATLLGVGVPLLVGVSRVYLDVHWATDVLGGWSAGVLIAALSATLYNRTARGSRAELVVRVVD